MLDYVAVNVKVKRKWNMASGLLSVWILGASIAMTSGQCVSSTRPQVITLPADFSPQYILSPSYPGDYPINSDCSWTLKAPVSGFVIRLEATHFDLEQQNGTCTHDFLQIYDAADGSDSNTLLLSVCNKILPPPVCTIGHNAFVVFRSDLNFQYTGFNITARAIDFASASDHSYCPTLNNLMNNTSPSQSSTTTITTATSNPSLTSGFQLPPTTAVSKVTTVFQFPAKVSSVAPELASTGKDSKTSDDDSTTAIAAGTSVGGFGLIGVVLVLVCFKKHCSNLKVDNVEDIDEMPIPEDEFAGLPQQAPRGTVFKASKSANNFLLRMDTTMSSTNEQ